ncbi:MAG: hypothetical protein GXY89_06375 [Tissierellia bacterium]|nr:hypothetical protein [Tissierellia bacterium]
MKKKLNIKYKIRILSVIFIFVLLNLGINIIKIPANIDENHMYLSNEETDSNDYFIVTANNGDTIWNIVKNNYNKIEKPRNMEFRDVISITIDLNGGSNLQIGQGVKLPKSIK